MRRAALVLCVISLACAKPAEVASNEQPAAASNEQPAAPAPAPAKPDTPPASEPKPVEPVPVPVPVPPSAGSLLIADGEGIHEVNLDGKRLKTIVTGYAASPRVLADGRVVFLRSDPEQVALALWMFTPGGETKQVAQLPQRWNAEACKAELAVLGEDDVGLAPQAPGDFRLDATKQAACLSLQDSNDNMANFGVTVWISLADGQTSQETTLDVENECAGPDPKTCIDLPLEKVRDPAPAGSFPFAYASETGTLTRPDGATSKLCRTSDGEESCSFVEQRSLTGRFELLSGEMDSGDYIYRELVILDRQDGSLWAIPEDGPLISIEPSAVFAGMHEGWRSATGEADLRWLPYDRLWFDGVLIDPAARTTVKVGGTLAFRLDQ